MHGSCVQTWAVFTSGRKCGKNKTILRRRVVNKALDFKLLSRRGKSLRTVWLNIVNISTSFKFAGLTWNTQLHGRHIFEKRRAEADWP